VKSFRICQCGCRKSIAGAALYAVARVINLARTMDDLKEKGSDYGAEAASGRNMNCTTIMVMWSVMGSEEAPSSHRHEKV